MKLIFPDGSEYNLSINSKIFKSSQTLQDFYDDSLEEEGEFIFDANPPNFELFEQILRANKEEKEAIIQESSVQDLFDIYEAMDILAMRHQGFFDNEGYSQEFVKETFRKDNDKETIFSHLDDNRFCQLYFNSLIRGLPVNYKIINFCKTFNEKNFWAIVTINRELFWWLWRNVLDISENQLIYQHILMNQM